VIASTIHVSYYSETYDMLIDWLAREQNMDNAHSLIARAGYSHRTITRDYAKKKPLSFSPWGGSFFFCHKRHLLRFTCEVEEHRERIAISCFGLSKQSTRFLKELIEECRRESLEANHRDVSVFEHREGEWKRACVKLARPISTVIMDEHVKNEFVKDVEDFLDESMQIWYAERGIPYRRGYLFLGPPGTGKSSLSFSIAGEFNLDIYTLSISGVSDSTLAKLFADLPQQCIVLIEDVDAAGMERRDDGDAGQTTNSSGVTLSGLLIVIDGVSSQEGRVLIMTTNHIERLDKALTREGRVDKTVYFELASRDVTSRLFHRVFSQMPGSHKHSIEEIDDEIIKTLASEFAAKVPEKVFSPAQLLSFLLERKKSPARAVSEVEEWIEKALQSAREIKGGDATGQNQDKSPLPTAAAENPESAAWPAKPSTIPGLPTPPPGAHKLDNQLAKATNEEDGLVACKPRFKKVFEMYDSALTHCYQALLTAK
jgi:chaperone BCS1